MSPGLDSVQAVLDWEMATLGDPVTDLASAVVWWDGIAGLDSPIAGVPGDVATFPSSRRLLERYVETSGWEIDDFAWYESFAFFKVAAILEGVYFRSRHSAHHSPDSFAIGGMVRPVIERGHAAANRITSDGSVEVGS
jgi:aminoglycoside phosphotransferase (APT) family kinase protein